jgi:hypothetical protein
LPPLEWEKELFNNKLHIETWHVKDSKPPFTKGILHPCKTRQYVDEVMDSKQKQLEDLFPQWKGKFHREAKVIIDGWKSCADDP